MTNHATVIASACSPASPIGTELLLRYRTAVGEDRINTIPEERAMLRTLCSTLERVSLPEISLAALDSAFAPPRTATSLQAERLRRVKGRITASLRETGELPSTKEMRDERRTDQLISDAPRGAQRTLRSWAQRRSNHLGSHELRHEIRRLVILEQVIEQHPDCWEDAWLQLWLRRIVRRIVSCGCPPPVFLRDDVACRICGKTAVECGTRPTPSEKRQAHYSSRARAYLKYRREASSTGELRWAR